MVLLAEYRSFISQGLNRLFVLEEEVYFEAFEDSLEGNREESEELSHSLCLHEHSYSGRMLRELLNHRFILTFSRPLRGCIVEKQQAIPSGFSY